MNHFLSIADHSTDELRHVLDVSFRLRSERESGRGNDPILAHKTLAMIFEKPSLRTRVSFQQAMIELGGHAIMLRDDEVGLGRREAPQDMARVLAGMVHGIMARVFEHQKLTDLAAVSPIPVINALSDLSHPCQALADAMTLIDEFGRDLSGKTMAYIGDGSNNMALSLAELSGKLGMNFIIAAPPGYELEQAAADRIMSHSPNMNLEMTHEPADAVRYADALYTDTWVSMGQESEADRRKRLFQPYQINNDLLATAPDHAIVLHCLPAYRGLEITDDVIDGPASRVFPQAHNRLHAQKGLLAVLMGGQ